MLLWVRMEQGGDKMTVKELKERLENAQNENAEVIINTEDGELAIVDVIGQYDNYFWIDTVAD